MYEVQWRTAPGTLIGFPSFTDGEKALRYALLMYQQGLLRPWIVWTPDEQIKEEVK